jgi:RNA polymerase sigma-70 factor, ECF subfamily
MFEARRFYGRLNLLRAAPGIGLRGRPPDARTVGYDCANDMNGPSDADLVRGAAAGNAACIGELYDRHAGRMKSLAQRIVRAPDEAEDVVQEVFVQAWRQAERFDARRGTVLAWLSIMVRSRSLDRFRRRATRRETSLSEAKAVKERPPRDDLSAWAANDALKGLPADQREPLELAYWQGLSQTEIAERLGLPLGTVKTRMRSGLTRLRDALE